MASSQIQYEDPVTDPDLLKQLNAGTPYDPAVTDPALLKQLNEGRAPPPDPLADIGKGLRAGATHDFVTGMAELPYGAEYLARKTANWLTGQQTFNTGNIKGVVNPEEVEGWWQRNVPSWAQAYEPQTPGGRIAETVGNFLPSMIGGGPSILKAGAGAGKEILRQLASKVALPTAGTEAGGAIATKMSPDAEAYGRALGGFLATPSASRFLPSTPKNFGQNINYGALPDEVKPFVVGKQITGQPGLGGGVRSIEADEGAMGALNKHFLGNAGAGPGNISGMDKEGNLLMPGGGTAVDANAKRIGKVMDGITSRNDFHDDPQMWSDIVNHQMAYRQGVVTPHGKDYIDRLVNGLKADLNANQIPVPGGGQAGWMSGGKFQTWSSQAATNARALGNTDPVASRAVYNIRQAVNSAYERALQRNGSPDAGALPIANKQWRANLALQEALDKQGQTGAQGYIRPDFMQAAARQVYDSADPGRNPFERSANAAHAFGIGIDRAKPKPTFVERVLGGEGALIPGLTAEDVAQSVAGGHVPGFGPAAIATVGAQAVGETAMDTPTGRALSRGQWLAKQKVDPLVSAIAASQMQRPRITVTPLPPSQRAYPPPPDGR